MRTLTLGDPALVAPKVAHGSQSFSATGSTQSFVVPASITQITVDVIGGAGGSNSGPRAGGGRVQCTLDVTPGETLTVYVGLAGTVPNIVSLDPGPFYGAGGSIYSGGTGGGLSAITSTGTLSTGTILVVAGAGGGRSGASTYAAGGAGGGTTGAAGTSGGSSTAGGGGTQSAGGAAGATSGTSSVAATAGEANGRHTGGAAGHHLSKNRRGGGGGAGYYGGGGGGAVTSAADNDRSGGGGGSSFTHPTRAATVTHTQGHNTAGHGSVLISW